MWLNADTNLYQLILSMGNMANFSESHATISLKITRLLGRKVDTWKIRSSEELVSIINEIKAKRKGT